MCRVSSSHFHVGGEDKLQFCKLKEEQCDLSGVPGKL